MFSSLRIIRTCLRPAFALTILLALALPVLAQDVHQIAERVDKHYNSLETLQADFVEGYRGGGMSRTESGTLWLKRPGRMRWEYRQPREKLFLTDGKTAWFYVPGERQARRAPIKALDDLRTPLAYLLGKTKLEKEFKALSLAPDVKPEVPGDIVLRGIPVNMAERVAQVLLEVNGQGQIERIMAEEIDGSVTEFRFSNQKENVAVSSSRFKFVPPPGVETVEMQDLGQ